MYTVILADEYDVLHMNAYKYTRNTYKQIYTSSPLHSGDVHFHHVLSHWYININVYIRTHKYAHELSYSEDFRASYTGPKCALLWHLVLH